MFNTVCEQFVKDDRRVCCKADDLVALFCHEKQQLFVAKSRNMHKLRSYTVLNVLTYRCKADDWLILFLP